MLRTTVGIRNSSLKLCLQKGQLLKISSQLKVSHYLNTTISKRHISDTPEQAFTKLTDENDPKRDQFFKYTWGSWLKNDKLEKEKRTTRFSIEGLNDVLNSLYKQMPENASNANVGSTIPLPSHNKNNTVSLTHNILAKNIGSIPPNSNMHITRLSSIHEGKHHRLYKIDTNLEKSFALRIPYPLDDATTMKMRIQSEVATMDFASSKLKINVPKIFSFAADSINPLGQPFILQEYIDGQLLMRQWDPLSSDENKGKLQSVIDAVSDIQKKLNSITFSHSGSIYFQNVIDSDPLIKSHDLEGRWCIGPSVERTLWRKKSALKRNQILKHVGPWSAESPVTDIIKDTAELELANVKRRLALLKANIPLGKNEAKVSENLLNEQSRSFGNLVTLAPFLFNSKLSKIPNLTALLKPRLFHPDLDPMNIILKKNDNGVEEPYLLDFENCSIKPFILQNSPQFIRYDGPKIYDLEKDSEEYKKLSDTEKQQYEFIYKRTRNEYMWENSLNERSPQLITSMAPPIKLLRGPYVATLERKTDEEFLIIDETMIQLKNFWKTFHENGLVINKEFPLEEQFSEEMIEKHNQALKEFHQKLITTPFAATQGWIPQDMFNNLLENGIIVKDADGNYSISESKI
ncbi:Aim9p NDAI_0A03120 [Naumovozyma dairenensis CBS 421]|uniref:Altered inheritance of mitochondria protein 9, mitochondrial n=1 Tax=Naumovozyma dairenensis (strain ATCC 10597 / BCRC 20456 / CBS 421 / NBRC 0211 / NRRL Y-12639) TaxID=1071378 RepID=G0W3T1_NAUDC|nr:hypothetical protein NDAI_0A03120 [Naumovozyma dairenensis CBS 421]CCD22469.1 hypothetical protein NDAI_0A03120 [Naumovozyma dairenensis CBS 421]